MWLTIIASNLLSISMYLSILHIIYMGPFVSGFFNFAQCFQGSFMLHYRYFIPSYDWIIFYYIDRQHSVCLSVHRHFCCFLLFAYNALYCYEYSCTSFSMNICFQFSWVYTRSRISRPYSKSMFNFLRNCQALFLSRCSILHSHQQRMRIPVSLHPH